MNYGTIKKATNYQHSHSIFVGFSGCIRQGSQAGRKARQCHHQGTLPPGGKNIPDHAQPCGAGHPPCHRSGLGQRGFGHFAKILWLHSQQYQGKTHEFGVYCAYRRQASIAAEIFGSGKFLKQKTEPPTAVLAIKSPNSILGGPAFKAVRKLGHILIGNIASCIKKVKKAQEFRVHRPYRRQASAAIKEFGSCQFLRKHCVSLTF